MDAQALAEILDLHAKHLRGAEGGRPADLRGADLHGMNLRGCKLPGADLSGANLCDAELQDIDLYSANLRGADLSGANFYGANLCDANLADALLIGTVLCGADLSGANLAGADLWGANFSRADLFRTNFCKARLAGLDGKNIALVGGRPLLVLQPIGSRRDMLMAWLTGDGVYCQTGCFFGTLDELKQSVREKHGKNVHGKEYKAAIALIKAHAKLWMPKGR